MPTTPNMNMFLPTVQVTLDPVWATELNDALTNQIDTHDHTYGKGVLVPSAGLNINADLSFNSNDATDLRSLSLNNNVSTLPDTDIRAVYSSGGNLYYNNNSGVPIQLTTGSSINTGALALNVWSHQAVASNLIIPFNASYIFLSINSSAAARTITLPAANAVTAGRFFIAKDATGSSATNNITITPAGADTIDTVASSDVINYAYGAHILVSDGISNWQLFKEGSPGATTTTLGTIKLAGDLGGTGTTFNTPRVIDATTGVRGKIQLAGDLSGDGTVSTAPTVSAVTGISGAAFGPSKYFSMGILPATDGYGLRLSPPSVGTVTGIQVRDSNDTLNIRLATSDSSNIVHISDAYHVYKLDGGQRTQIKTISSTSYTLDTTTKDNILFCNTAVGAITITLIASQTDGRVITIKDIAGQASTNNITVARAGSETIEDGFAANKILQTDYGSWTFASDSNGNWWMI